MILMNYKMILLISQIEVKIPMSINVNKSQVIHIGFGLDLGMIKKFIAYLINNTHN